MLTFIISQNPDIDAIEMSINEMKDYKTKLAFIENIMNKIGVGRNRLMIQHLNIIIENKIDKLEDYIIEMDYPL